MDVGEQAWEARLADALEDLEQQAEGLHLAARAADVTDLREAGFAEVALVDRVHASIGAPVRVTTVGATVDGTLVTAGQDWLLVSHARNESLVRLAAVIRLRGLAPGVSTEATRGVLARRRLGTALRQAARAGDVVAVTTLDGATMSGRLLRVGADFIEVRVGAGAGSGSIEVVSLGGLGILRRVGG